MNKNSHIIISKKDQEMRFTLGMTHRDSMSVSGLLIPKVAETTGGKISGAGAFVKTCGYSSNSSDFISDQRPR